MLIRVDRRQQRLPGVTRNTHVQYESYIFSDLKIMSDMAKVKGMSIFKVMVTR